jgi:PAS domain S-box-containing protein
VEQKLYTETEILRQKAEATLQKKPPSNVSLTEDETLKLIHELEVHQIELQMLLETTGAELSIEIREKANLAEELLVANKELAFQNEEKTKRAEELVLANVELLFLNEQNAKHSAEIILANKKLLLLNDYKAKRAAELIVANNELLYLNDEKAKRAEELVLANVELLFQNDEKAKQAIELILANKKLLQLNEEKARLAIELVVANKELLFQNEERNHRAEELVVANIELQFQNEEKAERAVEIVLANKELFFQNIEKSKRADELNLANIELQFQNEEKAKRAEELVVANKELAFQSDEKTKRADELNLANIELQFQNEEKAKRAGELYVANQLITNQRDRLEEIASLVPGVVYQYRLRPDGSSCFPYASEAIRQIYNVSPEEVREDASKVFSNLHPDDYNEVVNSIQVSAKELTPWQHEYRTKFDDGTIRTVFGNALPVAVADGSVLWTGFITDITEQKFTIDALQQSEEQFRVVVENSPLANLVHSNDIILYANPAAVHMFLGTSLQDLEGTSIWDRIHPDFHSIVLELIRKGIDDGAQAPFMEFRYLRLDGTIFEAEAQGTTIIYNGVPCIHVVVRDITEHKRLEYLLQENNTRLALATHMAKMAWWETDVLTGAITYDSQKVEMLGYTSGNFDHCKGFTDLIHPDDHEKTMNAMRDHLTGRKDRYEVEYRIRTQSGEYLWFYDYGSAVKWDDKGQPLYIAGYVIDISIQKRAEEELKNSEARYSSMIANISDVIAIMDADGLKKYESPNLKKYFGWHPEDTVGKSAFSFIHPDDMEYALKDFYSVLGEDRSVKTLEFRYECKDGTYKPIELTISNLLSDPLINGLMVSFRDISERKLAEELLQKSEMRYSSMISNISDVIAIIGVDGMMNI